MINTPTAFKDSPPGERFKRWHKVRGEKRSGGLKKALLLGTGLVLVVVGIVLMPAPGPGSLILIVGAILAAQESLTVARALDWAELRIRQLAAWGLRIWHLAVLPVKAMLVCGGIAIVGGGGYATYVLLFA